jgi:lipopolysaccharide export system permease protein
MGSLVALLVLVSLSLFFAFIRELDDLGKGSYGILKLVEYMALLVPGKMVEFMPLAVLLGCMLSLGNMASNSEITALLASGSSMLRLLGAVLQGALLLAVLTFVVADWIVPVSETSARGLKNSAQKRTTALRSREGLWIKDESRVLHLDRLLPNGIAQGIEIFQLDESGKLISTIRAERALPVDGGWQLHQVDQTRINRLNTSSLHFDQLLYEGNLSHDLLQVLLIEPRQMSSGDLHAYLNFLDENRLDAKVERLIYWQKIFAPFSILVMCLLAFPFVLGPQRQSNTGYRLMIGILLGLSFVVVDRLLTQLGSQYQINAMVIALLPNLVFMAIAFYLLASTQSHGVGAGSRFGRRS